MTHRLTPKEYQVTKTKLAQIENRLADLRKRADLNPKHKAAAERSYVEMIGQFREEMELFEATHPTEQQASSAPSAGPVT